LSLRRRPAGRPAVTSRPVRRSPGYGWEKLPPVSGPSIYESWTDLQPLAWTHLRLEVHGRKAQIFLNGSPHPASSSTASGRRARRPPSRCGPIPREASYFSNMKIENANPPHSTTAAKLPEPGTRPSSFDAGGLGGTLKARPPGLERRRHLLRPLGPASPCTAPGATAMSSSLQRNWPDQPRGRHRHPGWMGRRRCSQRAAPTKKVRRPRRRPLDGHRPENKLRAFAVLLQLYVYHSITNFSSPRMTLLWDRPCSILLTHGFRRDATLWVWTMFNPPRGAPCSTSPQPSRSGR